MSDTEKRRVTVETRKHLEHFEATTFGVDDGRLIVQDGDRTVAVFAAGEWLSASDEDARSQREAA